MKESVGNYIKECIIERLNKKLGVYELFSEVRDREEYSKVCKSYMIGGTTEYLNNILASLCKKKIGKYLKEPINGGIGKGIDSIMDRMFKNLQPFFDEAIHIIDKKSKIIKEC